MDFEDDVIDGSVEVVADDGDFDLNDDLDLTAAHDDDDLNLDLSRDDLTEENLHAQFVEFHAWHEKEHGEAYTAEDIPEAVIKRFNTFDVETGRHLSLIESMQKVNKEKEFDKFFNEGWATTDY